jgi:hypothetical protein
MDRRRFLLGSLAVTALACDRGSGAAGGTGGTGGGSTSEEDAPLGPLLPTSALAARLDEAKTGKLAILYVGPAALYERGRIPGARRVGEAGTEEGRHALEAALAALPPDTEAVVYCGCCPVRSCPNVRPASAVIRASKRKAHLLDLPTRFATDWADKGLPVERG